MTMKKWMEEHNYEEQKELAEMLESWLGIYTQEIFEYVMTQIDEIISSESTMKMIKELHLRMQKEQKRRVDSVWYTMREIEDGENKVWDMHNHVLEHSQSYRDVLYDLYIRDRKEEG